MTDSLPPTSEPNATNGATNISPPRSIRAPLILCPLMNLCNTCYFNAGVQLLNNCPPFVFNLRNSPFRHPRFRHRAQQLCRSGESVSHNFFHALAKLLHDMEFTPLPPGEALSPQQTLDCLAAVHPAFEGRSQQDCTEMINVVVATVAEEDRQVIELGPLLHSFKDKSVETELGRQCSVEVEPISDLAMWSKEDIVSMDSLTNGIADIRRFAGSWWNHRNFLLMHRVNNENELLYRKEKARRQPQQQQSNGSFQPPKLFYSSTTECFKGYMLSEVLCHTCGSTSRIVDEFTSLVLDIPTARQRVQYAKLHPNARRLAADGTVLQHRGNISGQWWNPLSWISSATRWMYGLVTGFSTYTDIPITLQECLDIHFEPVVLKGNNKYCCASCGNTSEATKKETLLSLPECLLIQMKRFEYGHCFNAKKTDAVVFPISWESGKADISQALSLNDYLHASVASPSGSTSMERSLGPDGAARTNSADSVGNDEIITEPSDSLNIPLKEVARTHGNGIHKDKDKDSHSGDHHNKDDAEEDTMTMAPQQPIHTYSLEAVVNHHGSIGGGHYTAHTHKRVGQCDTWVYISDDDISTVDLTEVADSEEYMLLYKKQPLMPRCSNFMRLREKAQSLLLCPADSGQNPAALEARFEGKEYVYISRPWLQQMMFFEEPGPILNHLCYCTAEQRQKPTKSHHGNIHTHGPPVEWFYIPLLRSEFDAFHRVYGGSAAVTRAEYDELWKAQEAVCTLAGSL